MYTHGREFNCKGVACYGGGTGPGPDGTFRRLQQSINAAASTLRVPLPSLAIDGMIGPATVQSLVEIARRQAGEHLMAVAASPTAATVARLAPELVAELAAVLPAAGTRPSAPTSTPTSPSVPVPSTLPAPVPVPWNPQVPTTPPPVPSTSPIFPDVPPRPNRTLWVVAGGAVAAAALIGLGIAIYSSQRVAAFPEPEAEPEQPA